MIRFLVRRPMSAAAGAALLALALPAAGVLAAPHVHHASAGARWLVANTKAHTVMLTLIAGYTGALGGYNFNGYGKGKMTVTIPTGYRVKVVFSNNGTVPHSAVITAYANRTSLSSMPPAFRGASSPNPLMGIGKGKTQRFSFVASKMGTYAIVCAVPSHDVLGMWDTVKVLKGASPSISYR